METSSFDKNSPDSIPVTGCDRTLRLFLYLIFGATLLPMVLIAGISELHISSGSITALGTTLAAIAGPGHVGLTSFFYSDSKMRSHFLQNPTRYIIIPIIFAITVGLVWQFLPEFYTANFLLFFFIWQTYHYQRQNYGILCFLNAATGSKVPISWLEKAIVELSAVAGILGMFQVSQLFGKTIVTPYLGQLFQTGGQIMYAVVLLVLVAIFTMPVLRRNKLRLGFLIITALFYLPTFVIRDPGAAIASYAYAHGIQYYVFMYFVASSHRRNGNDSRIILLVCAALTGATVLLLMGDRSMWGGLNGLMFGIYLSLVMSHFVIDAGVWKLRGNFQRSYMKESFSFLFYPRSRNHTTTLEGYDD